MYGIGTAVVDRGGLQWNTREGTGRAVPDRSGGEHTGMGRRGIDRSGVAGN